MNAIIGLAIVFGSVIGGFMMAGGHPAALWYTYKVIIIVGAGIGALVISSGVGGLTHVAKDSMALFKGNPYTKDRYGELLGLLYEFFQIARREGEIKLEEHVENPMESTLFAKYPSFLKDEHAVSFLADTVKVILTGAIDPHDLDGALDQDLDRYEEELLHSSHALQTTGDAMPAFGIVAAVLGVVLTMGYIGGGDTAVIGEKIGAALVGTMLGVLLGFGVFNPMAAAVAANVNSKMAYLAAIKSAILSYVKGDAPLTCIEFARRSIEPAHRPTFIEMEQITRKTKGTQS